MASSEEPTYVPDEEVPENPMFMIWCLEVCKQETIAMKYSRFRYRPHNGLKLTGVNRCMKCGTLYEATLPEGFDVGQRRLALDGALAKATMQRLRQEAAERGASPHAAKGEGKESP